MKTKKYSFSFTGRLSGAIGKTYKIRKEYEATSQEEAEKMLWTDYEHITGLTVKIN